MTHALEPTSSMLRTFLVGARNGAVPSSVAQVVRRIAALYGARLIVATVRDPAVLGDSAIASSDTMAAHSVDAALSTGCAKQVVLTGDFIEAVCEKGHEADVIVIWHQSLFGSNGEPSAEELSNLIRLAPRPIWLLREPVICPEHILVAYDGSAHSGRALHMAANLAETLGAQLTVLNVDESRDAIAQELILSRAVGYCEPYRITMERVGLFGRAAESIQAYVESSACQLLIVGAAGVGYLRGLLFGSVAGQLIANAACSVLVAK